jgi:ankyrin repeat protein
MAVLMLHVLVCVDLCRAGVAPVTGIHGAAKRNELAELRRLLDQGVDPNKVTQGQITPLMWAAAGGHVEAAQMLVAAGADTAPKSSCEHHCIVTCWC